MSALRLLAMALLRFVVVAGLAGVLWTYPDRWGYVALVLLACAWGELAAAVLGCRPSKDWRTDVRPL